MDTPHPLPDRTSPLLRVSALYAVVFGTRALRQDRCTAQTGQDGLVVGGQVVHDFELVLSEPSGHDPDAEGDEGADQDGEACARS